MSGVFSNAVAPAELQPLVAAVAIRLVQEADGPALAALMAELGYPTAVPQVQERLRALEQAGDQLLVAHQGAQVVGMVHLHRMHFLHRAPDGRIVTLVVTAPCRGLGIGAQLVAAAEEQFGRWGCGRVEVSSGKAREAAHRFYHRAGYEEQSKRFIKPLLPG